MLAFQTYDPKALYMDKPGNLIPNQLNIDESNIDE